MAKSGPEVHQANAPYRAAELRPPKAPFPWRRVRTVAMMAAVGGILGTAVWLMTLTRCGPVRERMCGVPGVRSTVANAPQRVLVGPDGADPMPLRGPVVVNVWLQGCEDCRPAFDAARRLEAQGVWARWNLRNVSFGAADPAWAQQNGVGRELRQDSAGSLFVRPFGISTFTTLVLDHEGREVWRGRPDQAGFVEGVDRALAGLNDGAIGMMRRRPSNEQAGRADNPL